MKNVLILGGCSDIAVALARIYAVKGCAITMAARALQKLDPILSDLKVRSKVNHKGVQFDALDFDSHQTFYDDLEDKPDIVICAFGYLGDHEKATTDFKEARQIIDANYTGAVSILNIVAQDFKERVTGTIIGISSVAGDRGRRQNYFYASAKAGFTAYLSSLRNNMVEAGVHVMTVKPGFVDTAMTQGLKLPPIITGKPATVAKDIYSAAKKKRNVIYTKWIWRWIMFIIIHIPEAVFKKLGI